MNIETRLKQVINALDECVTFLEPLCSEGAEWPAGKEVAKQWIWSNGKTFQGGDESHPLLNMRKDMERYRRLAKRAEKLLKEKVKA